MVTFKDNVLVKHLEYQLINELDYIFQSYDTYLIIYASVSSPTFVESILNIRRHPSIKEFADGQVNKDSRLRIVKNGLKTLL